MDDRVGAAREFAIQAHGDQRYGTQPYAHHLASVAAILEDAGLPEEIVMAGWLHDVVEDTAVTSTELDQAFGKGVAKLVDAVSGGGPRADHVSLIYEKITACPAAAIVKLADRIANIEAAKPGDKHSERYAREHPEFADVVRHHVPGAMWLRYLSALSSKARPAPHIAADVFGCLARKGARPVSIEEMNEAAAEGWAGER